MVSTIILLPGNMCDDRLWRGGGEALRGMLAARRLVEADVVPRTDATIGEMADRALAAVDGPLIPIGFSMGGIVALEMARRAPARVTGLVLADTTSGPDRPERAAARPGQQARVRAGELAAIVTDELKPAYLAAANRADVALKALLLDMALVLGPEVFVAQSEALRTRNDAGDVLDRYTEPILFAAGAEDMLCPPELHAAMAARARRATLRIIDGAGHMLPLEQPHAFAAAIGEWLDREQPA